MESTFGMYFDVELGVKIHFCESTRIILKILIVRWVLMKFDRTVTNIMDQFIEYYLCHKAKVFFGDMLQHLKLCNKLTFYEF